MFRSNPKSSFSSNWLYSLLLLFGFLFSIPGGASENDLSEIVKTAKKGDLTAQTNLGSMYYHGVGVKKNESKAYFWFLKAARAGDVLAQFKTGSLYQDGVGVPKNLKKALYWFLKVAEKKEGEAEYNPVVVGWSQLKLGFFYYNGLGVPRDYKKSILWFREAASIGLALAQTMMGRMTMKGQGVTRDDRQAIKWFDLAINQGYTEAESDRRSLLERLSIKENSSVKQQPFEEDSGSSNSFVALTVEANPPDATIRILNIEPRYHPGISLLPERYHIEVSKPGFKTVRRWVNLSDENLTVSVNLVQEPPIKTKPPVVVTTSVVTPPKLDLKPKKISPKPPIVSKTSVATPAKLSPKKLSLTVHTTPSDARVQVINIKPKYYPGMLLSPKAYLLDISKDGFLSERHWVVLKDRDVEVAVDLEKAKTLPSIIAKQPHSFSERFSLTVETIPNDARVRILNIKPPYTPGISLESGSYHVEVSKDGFRSYRRWIALKERDLKLSVQLQEEKEEWLSTLKVVPIIKDAHIRILNIAPRYRPGMLLKPGRYHIEVSVPGYGTQRSWVVLDKESRDVRVELQKESSE